MINSNHYFTPITTKYTNAILKPAPGTEQEIMPLPCVKAFDESLQQPVIISNWKMKSIISRIKFLFHGELSLQFVARTLPPIAVILNDYVELDQAELNKNQSVYKQINLPLEYKYPLESGV